MLDLIIPQVATPAVQPFFMERRNNKITPFEMVFIIRDFVAWKLYNISSGHYTIDNFELEAEDISVVLQQLQDYFQDRLVLGNQAGIGLSLVGVDILIDGNLLTVGWDNWSGIFIMASDAAGDAILRQLESYLNHK